jgi:hypothetical protein
MSEHGEHLAALIMTALAVLFAFAAVYGWSGVPQHPTASRVLKWIVFMGAAVWGTYSAIVIWRNKGTNPWTNLNWQDIVVIQAYALASWRWFAIIVIALFAFLIGRSTRNPIETETEALQKPDLEKSLSDDLRGCQDEWLHEKLKTDKATIWDLVWVASIFYRRDFEKSQPVIDFVFNIFNMSLLDVEISMDGGYVLFSDDNEQFHFDPKFLAQNPARCRSRDSSNFVIRQAVTRDEITKHFKDEDNTRISFGNLRVTFRGTEQFPEVTPTNLDVNHYLFTGQGAWHNPNRPKFLSEQESGLQHIQVAASQLSSSLPPVEIERANLVFLRVDYELVYYNEISRELTRWDNRPRSATWRMQHPAFSILVAYYRNQPQEGSQPISIKDLSVELEYNDDADKPFVVPRGLWFPQNRSTVDIAYNDTAGFILAEHHKSEAIFGRSKKDRVRLAEYKTTVNVRFFSGADGASFDGGKFRIESFETGDADAFDFSATRID